jgi:hypothetical protein
MISLDEKKAAIAAAFGVTFQAFAARHPEMVAEWLRQNDYATIDDWAAEVMAEDPALIAATNQETDIGHAIQVVVPMILKVASAFFPGLGVL